MAKYVRRRISREEGSYHIYSRVVGGQRLLNKKEKDYFIKLLKRLAKCFFVELRTFTVMSNHFHLLVKENEKEAETATRDELRARYEEGYGEGSEPPEGIGAGGDYVEDEDGGLERLRRRLASISTFMQELKQRFSFWYNKNNNRKGHFWDSRYKGPVVYSGAAEMAISAYIDCNAVRAGIVKLPENYKWCSLYLRMNDPKDASEWLYPVTRQEIIDNPMDDEPVPFLNLDDKISELDWYRMFVYISASTERKDAASLDAKAVNEMIKFAGYMGVVDQFSKRIKNFTDGIVIGSPKKVKTFQINEGRINQNARNFLGTYWSYATRVLRGEET